uniref:hypothetical protein n=1 Tax=Mycolicibacterium fortuitum TaxID=1766 RepID=UPI00186907EE|nr:hypothetical protein [Mycolicibacterium fortuitum]
MVRRRYDDVGCCVGRSVRSAAVADTDWTAFPGGIAPGAGIAQARPGGDEDFATCTLGVIAGDPSTHKLYGIAAGHCDHGGPVLYSVAEKPDTQRTLGTYVASRGPGTTITGDDDLLPVYTDAGVIAFAPGTPIASFKIGGRYPVRAVLKDRKDVPYGTEVCKYGMKSGETCGPVVVAAKYTITAQLRTVHGDSGAPLYRKNRDGTADLIGIASSVNEDSRTTKFFWIAPVLEALNLEACGCGAI